MRWSMEITFEEARVHLGMETQRQWSNLAIQRTTPVLLSLYSIVTWSAAHWAPHQDIPIQRHGLVSKGKGHLLRLSAQGT